MDAKLFDSFVRAFATGMSRRGALRTLAGGSRARRGRRHAAGSLSGRLCTMDAHCC